MVNFSGLPWVYASYDFELGMEIWFWTDGSMVVGPFGSEDEALACSSDHQKDESLETPLPN